GPGIGEGLSATLPCGRAERIGHADLVVRAPPRWTGRVLGLRRGKRGSGGRGRAQHSRSRPRSAPCSIIAEGARTLPPATQDGALMMPPNAAGYKDAGGRNRDTAWRTGVGSSRCFGQNIDVECLSFEGDFRMKPILLGLAAMLLTNAATAQEV